MGKGKGARSGGVEGLTREVVVGFHALLPPPHSTHTPSCVKARHIRATTTKLREFIYIPVGHLLSEDPREGKWRGKESRRKQRRRAVKCREKESGNIDLCRHQPPSPFPQLYVCACIDVCVCVLCGYSAFVSLSFNIFSLGSACHSRCCCSVFHLVLPLWCVWGGLLRVFPSAFSFYLPYASTCACACVSA